MKDKLNLNINYIQYLIMDALEDVKGQNILVFDTSEKSNFFDRVIIASGVSNRQTRALAKSVVDKLKKKRGNLLSLGRRGQWRVGIGRLRGYYLSRYATNNS